jgi:hypothetical protein
MVIDIFHKEPNALRGAYWVLWRALLRTAKSISILRHLGLLYWASGGYHAALMGGHEGGPVYYIRYEPDILDIFSEYSLKIPRIYSNILKYTRIFPCWVGVKVYRV